MNFFIISNSEESTLDGVLIESSEGIIGARLAGEDEQDGLGKVLPSLLRRMPPAGFHLDTGSCSDRRVVRYRPGQPDFARAMLRNLDPPFIVVAWGVVYQQRIDPPRQLTKDIWQRYSNGEELPAYKELELQA